MKVACVVALVIAIASSVHATELRGSTQLVDTRKLAYMNAMTGTLPLKCIIENGFDYVNNDYDSKPSSTAEGCCDICKQSSACGAFTWSNHNGGTCWLKTGRGQVIVNPNTKSAVLAVGFQEEVCPTATADTDFVGNDLANYPSSSFEGCCRLCATTPGCRAYSWSDYQTPCFARGCLGIGPGTCWIKTGKGATIAKTGVKSAEMYPVGFDRCQLAKDVDFKGFDIGNVPAGKASDCCAKCALKEGCKAFTWTNHNGGTCWLKDSQGPCDGSTHVQMAGAMSCNAVRQCV